jgi:LDH2 family malate/lactate/ureidoglycolate dehydrogenase
MWNDFKNPQNVGHFFSCIDISKFTQLETFKERLGRMKKEIKALPKNAGVSEIFMPGEIEWNNAAERREKGVPVPEPVYNELKQLGDQYKVKFDL